MTTNGYKGTYQYGTFVNGDYWVKTDDVSGVVNVIKVTPETSIYSFEDRNLGVGNSLWYTGEYWVLTNADKDQSIYHWRRYDEDPEEVYGWWANEDWDRSNRPDRLVNLTVPSRSFSSKEGTEFNGEIFFAQGSGLRDWDTGVYIKTSEMLNGKPVYSGGYILHGSMINPEIGKQAFDSASSGFDYDYLVDFPDSFEANTSILSAISQKDSVGIIDYIGVKPTWGHIGKTETIGVLTIVDEAQSADAFRPPYAGDEKPIYHADDIDWDLFPKLLPPQYIKDSSYDFEDAYFARNKSITVAEDFARYIKRPWILHISGPSGRNNHPTQNMPNYHREVWRSLQNVAMLLTLDLDTIYNKPGELKKIVIPFIQLGIDSNYASVDSSFSKLPVIIAGELLGDESLKNASEHLDRPDWMCYYRDEATSMVVSAVVPEDEFYHGFNVGWRQDPGSQEHEHLDPETEWNLVSDGGGNKRESYRRINSPGFIGYSLVLRLFNLTEERDNPALFEYADRWVEGENQSSGTAFIDEMWDEYRNCNWDEASKKCLNP